MYERDDSTVLTISNQLRKYKGLFERETFWKNVAREFERVHHHGGIMGNNMREIIIIFNGIRERIFFF